MASPDEEAVIRCAAMRAQLIIEQTTGAFSILVEQMSDRNLEPDRDQVSRWCSVIHWLKSALEDEVSNLADSLSHDELVAKVRRP